MPPRPAFRTRAIEDLNRQLAFAPESAQRSRLEAAEDLIRDIEPDRAYPLEFVVFRLTGYRPDEGTDDRIVGDALRADLVTMIQTASRRCPLQWDGPRGRPLGLDDVAARLGVARRSLRSLRPRGLVFWWTQQPGRAARLGCPGEMLDWFTTQVDAPTRSGINDATRHQLLDCARRVDDAADLASLVRRVSGELGLGEDLVRGVLRRAAARGEIEMPVARRLERRDGRMAMRAHRRGIATADIARRLDVGVPSVHRALRRERLALLTRCLARPCMIVPDEAWDWPVDAPPLRWDSTLTPGADVGDLAVTDIERLAAAVALCREAAASLHARSSEVAWTEADSALMSMTRCWWHVLRRQGAAITSALQAWAQRPVGEIPPMVLTRVLGPLLDLAIDVLRRATIDDVPRLLDRTRGAADRFLIDPAGMAPATGTPTGGVFLLRYTPWRLLLPDPRWERALWLLDDDAAALAGWRFGLAGQALLGSDACAQRLGCSAQAVTARTGWLRRRLHDLSRWAQ